MMDSRNILISCILGCFFIGLICKKEAILSFSD